MATKKTTTTDTLHQSPRKMAAVKRAREMDSGRKTISRAQVIHLVAWMVVLVLAGWFLHSVAVILLPFILGSIMAYLFDPLADRLEKSMKRSYATVIITFGFFSVLVALLAWLGPMLYDQLGQLITKVPYLMREIEILVRDKGQPALDTLNKLSGGGAESLPTSAGDFIERGFALGGQMLLGVLASGGALLNVLSLLLITPIVSFYLLRDWDHGVAKINKLLPLAYAPTIRALARDINRTLAGYLRGQLYVILILAAFYVIALSLIGLKFSLVIGVLAGCLVIVPYLGTVVSTALGLIVAYSQYDLGTLFWVTVGIFGVGQILESQILTPIIIGDRVGLHPLWLLFGMLAGGVLLGFVGVLLAVPITAVISVLVKFVIGLYLDSSLYTDK